jgi:hypothetical protein
VFDVTAVLAWWLAIGVVVVIATAILLASIIDDIRRRRRARDYASEAERSVQAVLAEWARHDAPEGW